MALCFVMFSLSTLPLFACIGRTALTIFIFIARAFITGGYQVAFVYTPEVFPTEVRALGMGTCSTMAKLGALLTPFVSQTTGRGLQESHSPPPAGLETTDAAQHTDADKTHTNTHTHTIQDGNAAQQL
ncbi:hypothetical protein CRUP_027184 [Coryphaenoides rupestris]|nr:hypothetical protein CRUP_027184 [Coryphaenoides rupestris]